MNLYIVVEGDRTETQVYPAWLKLLLPDYVQINDAWLVTDNNYYLLSGGGIPSIYDHIANSVLEINNINKQSSNKYDYLVVCIDTEECEKGEEEKIIRQKLAEKRVKLIDAQLVVIEHQVCMESWFLGNRKVFKRNPQNQKLLEYIEFYNVGERNPELMDSINSEDFTTKAQFHFDYLKKMLAERNMRYSKNNTTEVQKSDYLNELINRCSTTKDLLTFKAWYDFVKQLK
ncbi:MAG: hypothetical protein J6Y24_02200 [Bacteroidales bacterium]|nr:hypothetical protein [Bacteroidales bacterium]